MIQDLDKTLKELLRYGLPSELAEQVHISFATPDTSFPLSSPKLPAINLFLYNIQENRELRNNEWLIERKGATITKQRPPVRVDCSYLITVWPSENVRYPTEQEHQILGEVMRVLLRYRKLPAEILQGDLKGQEPPLRGKILQSSQLQSLGEIWQAMGGKPRAILHYTVTISVQVDEPVEMGQPVVGRPIALEQAAS